MKKHSEKEGSVAEIMRGEGERERGGEGERETAEILRSEGGGWHCQLFCKNINSISREESYLAL